jgi:anti-sigma factor RsiW
MDDRISGLSEQELAELSALADGTLPAERRAAVEARVAGSPELQELLDRQRRALAATQSLASEPVPHSLRDAVEARRRARPVWRRRAWRPAPRLALVGGVAVLAAVLAVVLVGGPGGPSVAQAAELADRPASEPAPARAGGSTTQLALDVEGVTFPDFARSFGWRAVGLRRDELDGRDATTVFYEKGAREVAYVIVSGPGLPRPSDVPVGVYGGVRFQTLQVDGRLAVTWQRLGHTCVLVGTAPRDELIALANWRGDGTLRY